MSAVPSLQQALYASAAILIDAVADPAVVEASTLPQRTDALNAVGRFLALLHKMQGETAGGKADAPIDTKTAAQIERVLRAAEVKGFTVPADGPRLNRRERRKAERELRRA